MTFVWEGVGPTGSEVRSQVVGEDSSAHVTGKEGTNRSFLSGGTSDTKKYANSLEKQ